MSKQHILIIGASSAIGCETIRLIAREDLVVLAHFNTNRKSLDELATAVSSPIVPIQADLRSVSDTERLLDEVESHCAYPLKIVFLAAPKITLVRFKSLDWVDFQRHIDAQLHASFLIARRFVPRMGSAKAGKLVFVLSSYTSGLPPAAMAHYVTAKYAVLGLMKSMAGEYASRGVCINAISPSMVRTDFLSHIPSKLVEIAASQHPLRRNANPSDIAPAIKFLLSEESGFITGANIPITGGSA